MSLVKKQELAAMLEQAAESAPKLRAAGVLMIDVHGFRMELAALAPEADVTDETIEERAAREEAERRANPWDDPDTYGRRDGVPGNDPRKASR